MRLPVSTTVLVQRTPLVYSILFRCKCSQTHWHSYQAIFFSNLNISIKHRQIGEQSVRFGLHKKIQDVGSHDAEFVDFNSAEIL